MTAVILNQPAHDRKTVISEIPLCPFCKGVGEVVKTQDAAEGYPAVYVVQCSDCGCQGPGGETDDQAVEEWARRG